ncbi:MAG: HK97 gp10 family phage protein [Caldilineaceae bacterium]|nr:HK97 gp10 family phage protein [Caldilineaceae bacterium]
MSENGDIEGMDSLIAKLNTLARAVHDDALEAALMSGANLIVNGAKAVVPVLTGTLQRSIHAEARADGVDSEARIGTNVEYSAVVEFGDGENRAAKPYLRPAYDENLDAAVKEVGDALRDIIRKAL